MMIMMVMKMKEEEEGSGISLKICLAGEKNIFLFLWPAFVSTTGKEYYAVASRVKLLLVEGRRSMCLCCA